MLSKVLLQAALGELLVEAEYLEAEYLEAELVV